MQQVQFPRQEPSNILPYLARPIAEHEGEPAAYQLYPFTTNYDPGSPICESTFPTLTASAPPVSAPVSRQLASVSKTPTNLWSWKKKGVPWNKVKLIQPTQNRNQPLELAPPPFPLPETINVLVAGVSRSALLKPSKKISFGEASCSRENFPMSRID